jgi:hypothetical protein
VEDGKYVLLHGHPYFGIQWQITISSISPKLPKKRIDYDYNDGYILAL